MSFKRKLIGFTFAWNGLREVTKNEWNFRLHLLATCLVIISSLVLRISLIEWGLVSIAIGFVLVAELVNSAIERIIDYLRPEIHPLAKAIKDIGAAAVLIAAMTAASVGFFVFLPKLIALFY